ncbi:hypothetical protein CF15_08375 [Pyrodictium occultum]|uniref:Glycosyl transferase family 28 C-terminal domain-containing protein n=1 Tax=Pyrodictium occultum TaxID=2309 RepID=A0A0V8RRP5_PYROC|nr:hypothetical protein [Pyrodictium occultum]KSW10780.1 hypothetical protein CF15_08375 [Pyrodictium occultum]
MGEVLLTAAPGGHSGYAAAIAHYLRGMGLQPVFIAARGDELARRRLSRLGRVVEITMPRRPGEPLAATIHRWPRALAEALGLVERRHRVLVSCGGNLSIAPALAAKLKGLRLVNLESIVRLTTPGRTPRLLRPLADATLVHWPEQLRIHPGALVVGPVYEPPRYPPRDEGYILVTAGTMGHPRLFDAVDRLAPPRVVMQTGRVDPEPYRRRHPGWRVFRYDPDLDRWIAGASIVVTHFPGMTSATAALAYRRPVVLVAAPHLRLSASQRDGPPYAEKIGAVYLPDPTPQALARAMEEARSREPPRHPNGAEKAAEIIARLYRGL